MLAALRGLDQRSACFLPLATALGPVGLIGLASGHERIENHWGDPRADLAEEVIQAGKSAASLTS